MGFAAFHGARPPPPKPVKAHAHERPWLSHEAMQQLVGEGGGLGPLFADLTLGGPAPAQATRERIAAFAHAHDVAIRLETQHDELVAVHVGVTFGGCCGYEGADTFGRLVHRSLVYANCCPCRGTPADDWSATSDDGLVIRGHVHVNQIDVRWEAAATVADLLDRGEGLLGESRAKVRARAGDRWHDGELDTATLEVPHPAATWGAGVAALSLSFTQGRVAEVTMPLSSDEPDDVGELLRARYGRPRDADEVSTWRLRDRVVTFDRTYRPTITITATATSTALARAAERSGPRS